MRILISIVIIMSAAAIIGSCSSTHYGINPTETDVAKIKTEYPQASLQDLQAGFNIWKTNCSGCHLLHLPKDKTAQQWKDLLPEMFTRTTLNEHERELVREYLLSKAS